MKTVSEKTKAALLLLLLAPSIGELLSGSSPPSEYFHPAMLVLLTALYGCGALIVRELAARWNLQWSIVFLAIAYGILEEGIVVQSFFNAGWSDLAKLSGYGMYFGVQWPWAIMLTVFHATISTLVPIAIIGLLWPQMKNKPLLGNVGLAIAFISLIAVTILGMAIIPEQEGAGQYEPDIIILVVTFAIVVALVGLSYLLRGTIAGSSGVRLFAPWVFGLAAFSLQIINIFGPTILADLEFPAETTIASQVVFVAIIALFVFKQIFHPDVTKRHLAAAVSGCVFALIVLTPIYEFVIGQKGMATVGGVAFVLLILWHRKVLR